MVPRLTLSGMRDATVETLDNNSERLKADLEICCPMEVVFLIKVPGIYLDQSKLFLRCLRCRCCSSSACINLTEYIFYRRR